MRPGFSSLPSHRRCLLPGLWSAVLLVLLVLPAGWAAVAQAGKAPTAMNARVPSSVRIEPAGPATAPGAVVQVGLHVRNIYDLSLIDQSFLAEGWYWYQWGADVQAILDRNAINPDDLLELANEIELGQNSSQQLTATSPQLIPAGRFGRIARFSAKFYVDDVPQRFAPFDPQRLAIGLEVKPEVLAIGPQRLRLEPLNTPASIVGESAEISGFVLDSVAWSRQQVTYPDAFLSGLTFSRITATFVYGKNEWAMFLKWIFPLLVVMAIVIVSPSIEGVLGDIRIAIPPSALLTLVVMQDTYKNSFPPAPYLTYLDELYVYSYVACLAIFLLFLVGTNLVARAAEAERDRVARRVNRIDALVQVCTVAGFGVVALVGWFT